MKKALIIVLVFTSLLGFVGCDPGTNTIDGDELIKNTVKIELFYYENTNPKLYELSSKKIPILDFRKATFIAALDESRFEDVIKDIAGRECFVFGRTLNEPIGKTMILYQSDGDMIVLFGCVYTNGKAGTRYYGMCNIYDENGRFVDYLGDIDHDYVDALEAKYFENNT